jgi:YVTN family beta-propeller protein
MSRFLFWTLVGHAARVLTVLVLSVGPPWAPLLAEPIRSDSVSVFDTDSFALVAQVAVGQLPVGLAATADGTRIFVTNRDSGTVSVLDTSTNTVIATLSVGGVPEPLAVLSDGSRVYVGDRLTTSLVGVDPTNGAIIGTVPLGGVPEALAVSPDGAVVYVGTSSRDSLELVDTAGQSVIGAVPLPGAPQGLASKDGGSRLVITIYNAVSRTGGTIAVVDVPTGTVGSMVPFNTIPQAVAVRPGDGQVFITHLGTLGVSLVDLTTSTIVFDRPLDGLPAGLMLSPDGRHLYLTAGVAPSQLVKLDAATGEVVQTVTLGGTAQSVQVSPDSSRVYVAHRADGQ